jgi:predicted RNA binding protein YcfA (HicA-like mRNA interferase family)
MGTKLPSISGQDCMKALEKAGFYQRKAKGSHVVMKRNDPKARTVVPDHKELDRGLLRAIIRQAGMTVDEFLNLL